MTGEDKKRQSTGSRTISGRRVEPIAYQNGHSMLKSKSITSLLKMDMTEMEMRVCGVLALDSKDSSLLYGNINTSEQYAITSSEERPHTSITDSSEQARTQRFDT